VIFYTTLVNDKKGTVRWFRKRQLDFQQYIKDKSADRLSFYQQVIAINPETLTGTGFIITQYLKHA